MMGVWVVYDYIEGSPYAMSIHDSVESCEAELEIITRGHYCFWRIGTDLITSINDWVYSDRSHIGPAMMHHVKMGMF